MGEAGAIGHDGLAIPGKVDLAREAPFRIGEVLVQPAMRQVVRGKASQSVEPRVMQVLVALARANGGIVTREELTATCWDGRIVGDDAINRTLSRIRRIAADFGGGAFSVETIAKVGYRLVTETAAPAAEHASTASSGFGRRQLLLGSAAVTAAAAVGGALWWRGGARPNAEAAEYYRKGVEARSLGLIETSDQATAFFRQAVRADPEYAAAWGALARQMAGNIGSTREVDLDQQVAEVRSAAQRALAIDSSQADAQGALAAIQPCFRQWREFEHGLLRVARDHPGQRQANVELGHLYGHVARWDDSIVKFRELRRQQPLTPGTTGSLVLAYWSAGRLEEAEAESLAALQRWPRFHGMWFTRMMLLTYGGRPDRAVAFAQNAEHHPSGGKAENVIQLRLDTAKALASRNPAELGRISDRLLANVPSEIFNAPQAVRFFGAIGERDKMFDLLEVYYRRRGPLAGDLKPIHPLSRIATDFLFHPTSRMLWDDARFAALTRDIGLNDYWQAANFVPAHRRR